MAGFFIPGIGQGGGANPNPNPDAFTQARFDAQTNELVLTTAGGVAVRVNLQDLVPNAIQGTINNIQIVGTDIIATTVGGQQIQLPLSQVLNGTDVTFTPTANINSNTVSDAIVEVDGKINNAYTDANFNIANGELTLTKPNGQDKVLDLSDLMGVREFDYDDATKKITVLDHIGAIVEVDLSMFAEDTDLDAIREKLIQNATLDGNSIVITLNDNTEHRVDLTNILGGDITDVVYNERNHVLTVSKKNQPDAVYDLSDLIGVVSVNYDQQTNKITYSDKDGVEHDVVDLSKFVTSVNNQTPDQQGNVTVNAEHIEYDDTNINLGLSNVQEVLEYLEEDKASLNKDNIFIGQNTFNEAILLGKTPFVETSRAEETVGGHRAGVYCGYRRISTHHNNLPQGTSKYVSAIKIKVIRSFSVGEKVDGVCITEIRKTGDKATDVIGKTIVVDGSFIVEEDNVYGKCIYVPIQKAYTEDTYFLIGKTGSNALSECRYIYDAEKNDCVNNININALPAEGDVLGNVIGNGWIVIHSLVEDDINVRDALLSIGDGDIETAEVVGNNLTLTKTNGDTVTADLTPILSANNISFDNVNSTLKATTVQGAIDEVKELIDLLQSNTTTYFVNDKNEFDTLQQGTQFNSGDIVYVIDSTGVTVDGIDVNNDGKPVSLIYDAVEGKFRLLTKVSDRIALDAINVSFNKNTSGLQADNVQDAIDILAEKVNKTVMTLNNIEPEADGNINLLLEINGDSLEFKVKDTKVNTLDLYTEAEADALIAYFV